MTVEQVRAALAAASSTDDRLMRVVYLGAARAGVDVLRRDVDALEHLLVAQETEVVRLVGAGE